MLVGTHFLHRGCVTCVRIHAHSDVLLRGCTQAASLVSRGLGAPRSRAPPFLTPRPVPTPVHGHAADLPTCEPRGHDTRSATCDRGGGGQGERRGTGEPGGGGNARRRSRQSVRMGVNLRSRRGGLGGGSLPWARRGPQEGDGTRTRAVSTWVHRWSDPLWSPVARAATRVAARPSSRCARGRL